MTKTFSRLFLGVFLASLVLALYPTTAHAAFNSSRIIDDNVFNNVGSLSAAQIDAFLNQLPSSCISTNRGFTAPDPTGYSPSGGFTYGSFVSGGTVIAHAAQAYDLNPQVLLATLQKEQSLVGGQAGCSVLRYTGAVGYGCPDSGTSHDYSGLSLYAINGTVVSSVTGTCVDTPQKAGFSQQLIRAAWVLKYSQQHALGNVNWAIIRGSWDNSDDLSGCYSGPMTAGNHKVCSGGPTNYYDGYLTIDGTSVYLATGASASLYRYTPHFHGNQNFVSIWEGWWGPSLTGTYNWWTTGYTIWTADESARVDPGKLQPGGVYLAKLHAWNTGTATWLKDGPTPMVLGTTAGPSRFCIPARWISCTRPIGMTQASVAPGELGHFLFPFQAPFTPGKYREDFKPLAEMLSWTNNADGQTFGIEVVNPGTYNWWTTGYTIWTADESARVDPGNLQPNTLYLAKLHAWNTGTATWQKSSGTPMVLGTINNRTSVFCDPTTWMACSRPTGMYEQSAAPGQLAHFKFQFKTPSTPGSYREDFKPLAEMYAWTNDANGQTFGVVVR
jgi:hypothetical protein